MSSWLTRRGQHPSPAGRDEQATEGAKDKGKVRAEAVPLTQWAIIPWNLAFWTTPLEGLSADTADIVIVLFIIVWIVGISVFEEDMWF